MIRTSPHLRGAVCALLLAGTFGCDKGRDEATEAPGDSNGTETQAEAGGGGWAAFGNGCSTMRVAAKPGSQLGDMRLVMDERAAAVIVMPFTDDAEMTCDPDEITVASESGMFMTMVSVIQGDPGEGAKVTADELLATMAQQIPASFGDGPWETATVPSEHGNIVLSKGQIQSDSGETGYVMIGLSLRPQRPDAFLMQMYMKFSEAPWTDETAKTAAQEAVAFADGLTFAPDDIWGEGWNAG